MKLGADNIRFSAIQEIIDILKQEDVEIYIYEPILKDKEFKGCKVIKDFKKFSNVADIIIANRYEEQLFEVKHKLYSRDLFDRD